MYLYIWLGLIVLFLVVEAACPIHLVSIWFAVGALAALITGALGAGIGLQTGVFVVVSGALLALLWPFVRRVMKPSLVATNVDALVGTVGIVTAAVDNIQAVGQVKLNGVEWTARSTSGKPIEPGTQVRVDRIEGVKAYVSPAEVTAKV